MERKTLRTIGVVGSGQMGRGIAQVAAQSGFDVLLHDQDTTALDRARTFIDSSLKRLVEKGKLPERARAETLGRIHAVAEPGAFSAMIRSSSRLPADRTLAKDSVEVNQTFGSSAATRRTPRATAMVRPFISSQLAMPTFKVVMG